MSDTTTQAEYEAACARYNAISEHSAAMRYQIEIFARELEAEWESARDALRQHESQPGCHKPFAHAHPELTYDQLDELASQAIARLTELFPWAKDIAS